MNDCAGHDSVMRAGSSCHVRVIRDRSGNQSRSKDLRVSIGSTQIALTPPRRHGLCLVVRQIRYLQYQLRRMTSSPLDKLNSPPASPTPTTAGSLGAARSSPYSALTNDNLIYQAGQALPLIQVKPSSAFDAGHFNPRPGLPLAVIDTDSRKPCL